MSQRQRFALVVACEVPVGFLLGATNSPVWLVYLVVGAHVFFWMPWIMLGLWWWQVRR